ncbi:MAG: hypothetical protein KIS95_08095 [Anaerolineae bacterium]|uniref:hypothetical protein n=1 Tax=Promineifilum sp. TaxID=2664178 RepID=UPI001D749CD9|nr:hypothetical protein [Anaerolineales bacterium]MCB8934766.1 hypothetical protein [Promineifilum sp.]MCO5181539.1 hypothetical protein [Promineifilum sp.]MCW5847173.1 hypothetical protein [Anaerolineae bacterium]
MLIIDRLKKRLNATADLRDEAGGWPAIGRAVGGAAGRPDAARQAQYRNALEAWRANPYAKRIIDLITDYTVGDGITPVGPGEIGRFVDAFWHHPQNRLDLRLPDLMDELSRAGDLFLALFRNPADGLSYVRAVPKSEIVEIVTAENDWEREMAYIVKSDELRTTSDERASELVTRRSSLVTGKLFLSPQHPDAAAAEAVMVHYSINRPVGALLGESELGSILPALRWYNRMLEDRVRLNWAARAFLWFVTVPTGRVSAKAEQYSAPPEPGSIVVHDEGEQWNMVAPNLRGLDAQHDLRALRQAISAGSGQPPHWHGDGGDLNRAVAGAMQDPALRRLRRRQRHLQYVVVDLCHTAYERAYEAGLARRRPERAAIRVELPDISREDNESLALAAERLTGAFAALVGAMPGWSPTLAGQMLPLIFKFAGEPMSPGLTDMILEELRIGNQE